MVALVATATVSAPASAEEPVPPPDERIVGGITAPPGAWPSQAGLLLADRADNFSAQFCGGTVIATSWVLTAAHCLHDDGERIPISAVDVLTGTQDLGAGGRRSPAAGTVVHPDYVNALFHNDLALIQLDRPTTAPAQTLPTQGQTLPAGTPLTATGWGTTDPDTASFPDQLREVEVDLMSPTTCASDYQGYAYRTDQMICAGVNSGGKDACFGDSGGPLVTADGVQHGITSWGLSCAAPEYPGVYTRVGSYVDWIHDQIRFGPFAGADPFVVRQYLDLAGRFPTGDERSLANLLLANSGPASWLDAFLSSNTVDRTTNAVVRLYRAAFRRDPDLGGLDYWADQQRSGKPLASIAQFFARSRELVATYGALGDRGFVERVYGNVLGRAGDQSGIDFWTAELASGRRNRGSVLLGFSESAEYRSVTRARTEVITTYWAMLGRLPTEGEIGFWGPGGIKALAGSILPSREYALRF